MRELLFAAAAVALCASAAHAQTPDAGRPRADDAEAGGSEPGGGDGAGSDRDDEETSPPPAADSQPRPDGDGGGTGDRDGTASGADARPQESAETEGSAGAAPGRDGRSAPPGDGPEESPPAGARAQPTSGSAARTSAPADVAGARHRLSQAGPQRIRYFVEGVEVRGNSRTEADVIRHFVPLERGDVLDVDDPGIEAIRWRLLGTGWFDDVRLRLRRGEQRGWVVLVVEVQERNTLVIQQLAVGVSEGINNRRGESTDLVPFAGVSVAETNLLGRGMTLGLTAVGSRPNQGVELRFTDPSAFGSPYLLSSEVFFNNARAFFGRDPLVSITCRDDEEACPPEVEAKNAVVLYRRWGLSLGTGHDLGASTRYTLAWRGEFVDVRYRPEAASRPWGSEIRPIDFAIEDGRSFVSSLRLGLVYDRRDHPALPSRGLLVRFQGDGGTRLLGSDYDYLRLQGLARYWIRLPWKHYLRLGAYAGVVFGDAPFFYKFHVSDMTDLIPSRLLDIELDRRAPPNLLNTSIREMRREEIAGRIDVEYGLSLYGGGTGFFRAVTAYGGVGLYALADILDLQVSIPGYEGLSKLPIDMTFDLGVRADTRIGVLQLGFSNLFGFISL